MCSGNSLHQHKMGGCSLIRVCSLIRSHTVTAEKRQSTFVIFIMSPAVRGLQQGLLAPREPEDAPSVAHRREAVRLRVPRLHEGVQQRERPRQAPEPHALERGEHTAGRQAVRPSVRPSVCSSVRTSVRTPVRPSVRLSVHPSVRTGIRAYLHLGVLERTAVRVCTHLYPCVHVCIHVYNMHLYRCVRVCACVYVFVSMCVRVRTGVYAFVPVRTRLCHCRRSVSAYTHLYLRALHVSPCVPASVPARVHRNRTSARLPAVRSATPTRARCANTSRRCTGRTSTPTSGTRATSRHQGAAAAGAAAAAAARPAETTR